MSIFFPPAILVVLYHHALVYLCLFLKNVCFYYMCVGVFLLVCVCIMCLQWPQKPEDVIEFPETRVRDGSETLHAWVLGTEPRPSEEAISALSISPVLPSVGSSFSPLCGKYSLLVSTCACFWSSNRVPSLKKKLCPVPHALPV